MQQIKDQSINKMSEVHYCDICPSCKGKPKQPAVFFCTADTQYFCLGCATIHQRIDSTSQHPMQCLIPQNTRIPCLHQNEQNFYCAAHKVFCCAQCKHSNHSNCKDSVLAIEDYLVEKENLQSQSAAMLRNLEKTKQELEMTSKSALEKEKEWINQIQMELAKMNKAKRELEEKIGKKVEYMKGNVEKRREYTKKRKDDLQNAINDIRQTKLSLGEPTNSRADHAAKIAALKECLTKHEGILHSENNESQMAFLKAVEHDFEAEHYVSASLQTFQETVKSLNTIYSEVQRYIFSVQSGETLPGTTGAQQEDTNKTELKSIYTSSPRILRSQSERLPDETDTQQKRSRTQSETAAIQILEDQRQNTEDTLGASGKSKLGRHHYHSTRSLEDYQQMLEKKESETVPSIPVQSQCQMNVRVPSDETPCGITGIARLNDGYLLIADYENSKLKVFAPCGDFKGQLICDEKPRDMAKVDNNEFLVNFPMAKKIHFVTVKTDSSKNERQVILGKKIKTNAKCCGITFNRNNIYVATQIPHQILIINTDGVIQKIITGETLFERATYIAVEPDSSLIYISDPNRKVVLGITEEKEEKFRYKVERPHGIECARDGMLFVADWNWELGTIHIVNREGTRVGTLNVENCYCPQKLVFCPVNNTLLVTQWQKDILTTIYLGDKAFTQLI